METVKRKRERTFDNSEKRMFLEIITRHFSVIESKKTDGVNMKLKSQKWNRIAEEFAAASSTCHRDSQSLKTLWDNLKRKAKMAIAAQADNIYGTGGGKAKTILADPVVETVVGLIRPHVEAFDNMFDDNADFESQIITDKSLSAPVTEDVENQMDEEDEDERSLMEKENNMTLGHDWSQYSPAMLKAPVSAALRQPSQTLTQPLTHAGRIPLIPNTLVEMQSPVPATPIVTSKLKSPRDSKNVVSRRRPVLSTSASQTLLETRVAILNSASMNANEEHELEIEILQLKKKQEEEKLKQEEMKTELIRIQIERETGVQWLFAKDDSK